MNDLHDRFKKQVLKTNLDTQLADEILQYISDHERFKLRTAEIALFKCFLEDQVKNAENDFHEKLLKKMIDNVALYERLIEIKS